MTLSIARPAAADVDGPDESRPDPILKFEAWLAEAVSAAEAVPLAVALATVDRVGDPDVRMVTLRHVDERGFVVCTDLQSAKAAELRANPRAALCFHWQRLGRQVRIRGRADRIPDAEADEYFRELSRTAQIRAWGSRSEATADLLPDEAVPRPAFWSGYRIVPERVEFRWNGADGKLQILRFVRSKGLWAEQRLAS